LEYSSGTRAISRILEFHVASRDEVVWKVIGKLDCLMALRRLSRTISDGNAGCLLHPEGEVTAPDFVRSVLLTIVWLKETNWGKTLDLKKVKEFFQEIDDSSVSGDICKWRQYFC